MSSNAPLPFAISIEQVADHILGLSVRKTRQLLKDPSAPRARMLGERSPRYIRTEVEAWVANMPVQPVDDEPPSLRAARQARETGREILPGPFQHVGA